MAMKVSRLLFRDIDLVPGVSPEPAEKIVFKIQKQDPARYWCWAAVAVSVARYYNSGTSVQMCELAQVVFGNGNINVDDCCVKDSEGRPPVACDQPHNMGQALALVGHSADLRERIGGVLSITAEEIVNELAIHKRLVAVAKREGGGQHAFVIYDFYFDSGRIYFVARRPDGGGSYPFPFDTNVDEFVQVCFTKKQDN